VATALLLSCSDTRHTDIELDYSVERKSTDDPSEHRCADRGTPDALIDYVEHAYGSEYAPLYRDALHTLFLFVFTQDVADSLGLPPDQPWWGKTSELASAVNMFNSAEITRVEFSLARLGAWNPCMDIHPGSPPDTLYGQFARFVPDISVTIERSGEEPITLVVDNSYLDIIVVPDPNSRGLWTVARIQEIYRTPTALPVGGSHGVMTASTSWGEIKGMFR
jgi:hypothetical protein